jgi:hypothetical protein
VARVFTPEENAIHDAKRWINGRLHAMQEINIDEVIVISPEKQARLLSPGLNLHARFGNIHSLHCMCHPEAANLHPGRIFPFPSGLADPDKILYYISKSLFIAKLNKY